MSRFLQCFSQIGLTAHQPNLNIFNEFIICLPFSLECEIEKLLFSRARFWLGVFFLSFPIDRITFSFVEHKLKEQKELSSAFLCNVFAVAKERRIYWMDRNEISTRWIFRNFQLGNESFNYWNVRISDEILVFSRTKLAEIMKLDISWKSKSR